MKILSIDSKNTQSAENICFHLDRSPTEYEKEKITAEKFYGSLIIEFKDSNIILKSVDSVINANTIENINKMFAEVAADEQNKLNQHSKMISEIAKITGLTFY